MRACVRACRYVDNHDEIFVYTMLGSRICRAQAACPCSGRGGTARPCLGSGSSGATGMSSARELSQGLLINPHTSLINSHIFANVRQG